MTTHPTEDGDELLTEEELTAESDQLAALLGQIGDPDLRVVMTKLASTEAALRRFRRQVRRDEQRRTRSDRFRLAGLLVVVAAVVFAIADTRSDNAAQDASTLEQAVASCHRGNESRAAGNLQAVAAERGRQADILQSTQARAEAQALVDAVLDDSSPPAAVSIAEAYLSTVNGQQDAVLALLEQQGIAIAESVRAIRDCRPEVVQDIPEVTIPTDPILPTTSTSTPG